MRAAVAVLSMLVVVLAGALAAPQRPVAAGTSFSDISGSIYEDDIEWAVFGRAVRRHRGLRKP